MSALVGLARSTAVRASSNVHARYLAGLSLRPSTRSKQPTEVMETKRAEEVERCAAKSWKSAMVCLGNMRKGGVSPGSKAYNVALKACVGAGEWDRAAALLEDMSASGATPDASMADEINASKEDAGGIREAAFRDVDVACDEAPAGRSATVPGESNTVTSSDTSGGNGPSNGVGKLSRGYGSGDGGVHGDSGARAFGSVARDRRKGSTGGAWEDR